MTDEQSDENRDAPSVSIDIKFPEQSVEKPVIKADEAVESTTETETQEQENTDDTSHEHEEKETWAEVPRPRTPAEVVGDSVKKTADEDAETADNSMEVETPSGITYPRMIVGFGLFGFAAGLYFIVMEAFFNLGLGSWYGPMKWLLFFALMGFGIAAVWIGLNEEANHIHQTLS